MKAHCVSKALNGQEPKTSHGACQILLSLKLNALRMDMC